MHAGDWMFTAALTVISGLICYIWGGRNRVTASDVQNAIATAMKIDVEPLRARIAALEDLNSERKDHPERHPLANLVQPFLIRLGLLEGRVKELDGLDAPRIGWEP